jgi:hypothetical protein
VKKSVKRRLQRQTSKADLVAKQAPDATAEHLYSPTKLMVQTERRRLSTNYNGSPVLRIMALFLFLFAKLVDYKIGLPGEVLAKSVPASVMVFLSILSAFIVAGTIEMTLFWLTAHRQDSRSVRRHEVAHLGLMSMVLAWIALPPIFVHGYHLYIASYLQRWLPYVGTKTVGMASTAITLMTTGIGSLVTSVVLNLVSNAIWDWYKSKKRTR